MKVSLVATVKDAGPAIGEFLSSVARQTRQPDEVVVVDGGSTDGTLEILHRADGITLLSEPGANIARGRNVAIRAATHDVIAVSDADCVLAPNWLERLMEPIDRGADVSAGAYRPITSSLLETWAAASILEPAEIGAGWMPSSRSLAFRREAFDAAGGYPEWLEVGEDMYLNHRFAAGGRMELAPEAIAYWRMRPDLASLWRQYGRYAEGDALAGMYPERHLLRFLTYGFVAVATLSRNRWLIGAAVLGGFAHARIPIARTWHRLPAGSPDRWRSLVGVPCLMAFIDAAKMRGYAMGLARRIGRA
jgi:glycosyltransferase involved in cell wall biosynthesis